MIFINDIVTSPKNPLDFNKIKYLPENSDRDFTYEPKLYKTQKFLYLNIKPLLIAKPAKDVFATALEIAQNMKQWQIIYTNKRSLIIEVVVKTLLFGFKDDVVIKVTNNKTLSQIDMRSKSRLGLGDMGVNAKRISKFFFDLKKELITYS